MLTFKQLFDDCGNEILNSANSLSIGGVKLA